MITPDDAAEACERLLGERPSAVEEPGGRRRKSVRLRLAGRSMILTRRRDRGRAELEAGVLKELGGKGAPVPRVYVYEDGWLIQEDLGEQRLSQALNTASESDATRLLETALVALQECHAAAHAVGLESRVFQIGNKPGWLDKLVAMPMRLGKLIGTSPPRLRPEELKIALQPKGKAFIKWDARPGNAVVRPDGTLAWFDWEHCGCRSPLDDVAWLLGDEYLPDMPRVEGRLLDRHLSGFCGYTDSEEALRYLRIFGTLHMCVRLSLIFGKKGQGSWWNNQAVLAQDKVGVTLEAALNLSHRAARWSAEAPLTKSLSPWFIGLAERLEE